MALLPIVCLSSCILAAMKTRARTHPSTLLPEIHLLMSILLAEDQKHDPARDGKGQKTLTLLIHWPWIGTRGRGRRGMSKNCQGLFLNSSLNVEQGRWYGKLKWCVVQPNPPEQY